MGLLQHNFEEIINLRGTGNRKWNTYPDSVLPMWIAETDFKCPQPVVEAVMEKAACGVYSYYLSSNSFQKAVQNWMKKRFGWHIETDWVEFSPGVIAGITNAILSFTKPGDKVVIQSPTYYAFHSLIGDCGRCKVVNPMAFENGEYSIDFEDLENKLRDPEVTAVLICNPHNPISMAYSEEYLKKIGGLCLEYNVKIISDEAHSDLVYASKKHIPFSSVNNDIAQISMTFLNPSKSFNIGGLKTAATIIPNHQLRIGYAQMMARNQANIKNIFGQAAFEVAYNECDFYVDQLVAHIEHNVNYAADYFAQSIPRVKMTPADSSYMIWLDFRGLNLPQDELNRFLLDRAGIAMTDGARFGEEGRGFMRMNLSSRREVLTQALDQLRDAIDRL